MQISLIRFHALHAVIALGAVATAARAQLPDPPMLHHPALLARFPAEVRAAEAAGSAYPRPAKPLSALRRCTDASGAPKASSGEFVAGPFQQYPDIWRQGHGKLWWQPRIVIPGETLLVRATHLEHQSNVHEYRLLTIAHSIPDNGKPFYPSDIRLPHPGAWLLVATVGRNWGCFLLVI